MVHPANSAPPGPARSGRSGSTGAGTALGAVVCAISHSGAPSISDEGSRTRFVMLAPEKIIVASHGWYLVSQIVGRGRNRTSRRSTNVAVRDFPSRAIIHFCHQISDPLPRRAWCFSLNPPCDHAATILSVPSSPPSPSARVRNNPRLCLHGWHFFGGVGEGWR